MSRTCRNCSYSIGDSSGGLVCLTFRERLIPAATSSTPENLRHDQRLIERADICRMYVREPGAD